MTGEAQNPMGMEEEFKRKREERDEKVAEELKDLRPVSDDRESSIEDVDLEMRWMRESGRGKGGEKYRYGSEERADKEHLDRDSKKVSGELGEQIGTERLPGVWENPDREPVIKFGNEDKE